MKAADILKSLKKDGHRLTKTRKLIISYFAGSKKPLSAPDIQAQFELIDHRVNKTTIYREIEFLIARGILIEVQFNDGQIRYEMAGDNHHHHLVCKSCRRVDEIDSTRLEAEIHGMQKFFKDHKDFTLIDHSLEFFGLCGACK